MGQRRHFAENARVADQDVELAPALVDGTAEAINGVEIREVDRDERSGAAKGANLVVELFEGALRAGEGDHMRAGSGEGERGGAADAARGAGHDRDAIGERFVHRGLTLSSPASGAREGDPAAGTRGTGSASPPRLRRSGRG